MRIVAEFPYFEHLAVKLVCRKSVKIDTAFAGKLVGRVAGALGLKVLKQIDYDFPNGGLTRVLILSQSHLICHTWPELGAIHIDLMTCAKGLPLEKLQEILAEFSPVEATIQELRY